MIRSITKIGYMFFVFILAMSSITKTHAQYEIPESPLSLSVSPASPISLSGNQDSIIVALEYTGNMQNPWSDIWITNDPYENGDNLISPWEEKVGSEETPEWEIYEDFFSDASNQHTLPNPIKLFSNKFALNLPRAKAQESQESLWHELQYKTTENAVALFSIQKSDISKPGKYYLAAEVYNEAESEYTDSYTEIEFAGDTGNSDAAGIQDPEESICIAEISDINAETSGTSVSLSWNKICTADYYVIYVDGTYYDWTEDAAYSIDNAQEGEHEYSVEAYQIEENNNLISQWDHQNRDPHKNAFLQIFATKVLAKNTQPPPAKGKPIANAKKAVKVTTGKPGASQGGTTTKPGTSSTTTQAPVDPNSPVNWDLKSVFCFVDYFIKLLLKLSSIVATIFVMYSSILYVFAYGDEAKAETAKKTLIWSLIGLAVVSFAFIMVILLKTALSADKTSAPQCNGWKANIIKIE